jgi:hypothetical protein
LLCSTTSGLVWCFERVQYAKTIIFCFELNEVPEYNSDCGGEKLQDERHGDVGQYMLSQTPLGPYLPYLAIMNIKISIRRCDATMTKDQKQSQGP